MIMKIDINEIKEIPENKSATCLSESPKYERACVVWSVPPTNGDCPFVIRLMTTVVVSVRGMIKTSRAIMICFDHNRLKSIAINS